MVKISYRDKQWEVPPGITVRGMILKVGLNPETVLAVREGKLINDKTVLPGGSEIKLVPVVSGG